MGHPSEIEFVPKIVVVDANASFCIIIEPLLSYTHTSISSEQRYQDICHNQDVQSRACDNHTMQGLLRAHG